jgi:dTDP-4-dehydrorhamnose 3,5-epimerase
VIFSKTRLPGAYIIGIEPAFDERGFFARAWDADEFAQHGLETALSQCSLSFNKTKDTLRGMHYQVAPHFEIKVVSCNAGAIYDVIVDLRPASPTFRQWLGVELSAENRRLLYIPQGLAHGFLTLQDNSEVYYQISGRFVPESGRGVRWNDPAFGIEWPATPSVISERDRLYPDFAA